MNNALMCEMVGRLMREPSVPYHEHGVRNVVANILRETGLEANQDRFGNLLTHLKTDQSLRPLVLSAHMDHPGFEVTDRIGDRRYAARFRGGVAEAYFQPGVPVRLYPGAIAGELGEPLQEKIFVLHASREPDQQPAFAVWDLEDFALTEGRIVGRACDDLVGAACILTVLAQLKLSNEPVNIMGVFTRAEEVGFHGALALAADQVLPRDGMVISLETSRELPGCSMGNGVILRMGDRASTFDDASGRFLAEIAQDRTREGGFCYQRALMSGGTCEGTAYQAFGYQVSAVCVALGNYHNAGATGRIEAEYVSVDDVASMVELLCHAAMRVKDYEQVSGRLPARLRSLLAEAQQQLPRTATNPTAAGSADRLA